MRIAALLAGTIIASGSATQALAQPTPVVPPVRQEIDENGVDLMHMSFNTSESDLSIGEGEQGLSFGRIWSESAWRYNLLATISYVGSTYTVSFGGRSDSFTYTTWPNFVSTEGNGATLVLTGSEFTYTGPDGTVAVFGAPVSDFYTGKNVGMARHITFPSGDRWTYHNKTAQYCQPDWNGVNCNQPVQMVSVERPQSITNRAGYQIKLEYASNSLADYPGLTEWRRVTKATAVNNAVEYCDPMADSCSFANAWPYVTYTKSGTSETVADSTGTLRSYSYDAPGTKIVGIRRATAASDSVTVAYASGRVSSVVNEGVTFNYTYSAGPILRSVSVVGPPSYTRNVQSHVTYNFVTRDNDALNRDWSYVRDASGRIQVASLSYEGIQIHYSYDARGNVTQTRTVAKTGSGLADIITTAGYDASCTNPLICNKPLWTRDAKGNQTDYTYDPVHGGVLTVTLPAATAGGVRPQTRYTYQSYQAYAKNSAGSIVASGAPVYRLTGVSNCQTAASCTGVADETKVAVGYGPQVAGTPNNLLPVSVTKSSGDGALSATAAFTYDNVGNRLTVDGPLAGTDDTSRTRYDARRRVVGTVGPDPDGAGARKPLAQRTTYNLDNRPTNVEVGNVNSQSDGDWAAMSVAQNVATTYDANARPAKTELKSGGVTQAVTQASYDGRGRVDCVAERMNPAIYTSLPTSACTLGTAGSFGEDRITKTSYNAMDMVTKVQTGFGTA
ncbi:hypothetical protein EEB18_003235 [Sphingopyxis sp. OPL5]|uniref:hypothetical protein n=1 Tax=Sphingopyxis sp. OPL5 TaxID=2486273 RepID=UPI00164E0404|nr:hypothetical protein [Sphingopyxis sp. OPL5]QNO28000.1 hypothetical protein EEB18_003235 [Sphingopyxis sp. OPL5]